MSKLLKRATLPIGAIPSGRFEKFNLIENPFPSQAILNKDSTEKKFNGSIYEPEIRTAEFDKIVNNFIKVPQNDINHQRLGLILDSSYIGRGNGKTAFLLNLLRKINEEFCLDLSEGVNKCFGVYFQPEAGGKTKTFDLFVDLFFQALLDSNLIKYALAILRIEAIITLTEDQSIVEKFASEDDIVNKLNDDNWFRDQEIIALSKQQITQEILKNDFLQNLSKDFPLNKDSRLLLGPLITQSDIASYYNLLKKGKDRLSFIFTDLVAIFLAAGFNGAYIFIDDFERIPDHQSAIQKKDFVTQLRTVLYDGLYLNSKIGFFNMIFALHAGVPRILQEAWGLSGLEQRVSINPSFDNPRHMILFDKINEGHAVLLIKKYLSEFRIEPILDGNILTPFTEMAVRQIGLKSELNAAKILQMAYNIIEHAAENNAPVIDDKYTEEYTKQSEAPLQLNPGDSISNTETIDLLGKATKRE